MQAKLINPCLAVLTAVNFAMVVEAAPPYAESFMGVDDDGTVRAKVKQMPSLRRVKFVNAPNVTDNALAALGSLKDLAVIDAVKTNLTGDKVGLLKNLPLERITLEASPVVDDHLKTWPSLALRHVSLRETPVTNRGAWYISYIASLNHLDLSDTRVTDQGVAFLKRNADLRYLYLLNTRISDEGAKALSSFSKLDTLDVRNTDISDLGVAMLAKLPKIRQLYAGNPKVTDAALQSFKNHPTIESLNLTNSQVSDTIFPVLATMPKLKSFEVNKTNVTASALQLFAKQHPNVAARGPQVNE